MADKFFIRIFQPLAAVSTDAVLQFARTKNGVATRTLLADLDDAGLFRATSFGIYGGSNGTDFSSAMPGLITVSKGLVTAVSAFTGFVDTTAIIVGSSDATKKLRFEVDGFTTATTRVLTPLNKDYTIEETGHQAKHNAGGGDTIVLDTLGAPTDITTLNSSTSAHGLLPKLDNTATHFFDGTGSWDTVKDSDLSLSNITTNDVSTSAHGFTPILPNDATKFLDGTGAWTNPAAAAATWSLVINESGASLSNWTQTAGSWSVVSSAFFVNTGATTFAYLRYTAKTPHAMSVIQADVKIESTGGFGADNRVGFRFNWDSTSGAGSGNSAAIFMRCTGALNPSSTGGIYSEGPFGVTAGAHLSNNFNLDQYYNLKIVLTGRMADIYIDGTYITSRTVTIIATTLPAIESAYVGCIAYNCKADFKNFKMYKLTLP